MTLEELYKRIAGMRVGGGNDMAKKQIYVSVDGVECELSNFKFLPGKLVLCGSGGR